MKCWICKRQARGLGCRDGRFKVGDPRRYPVDWVFCSRRCQDVFLTLYGNWRQVSTGRKPISEVAMIDASEMELAAMRACLKPFGKVAADIGFDKPLGAYSEAEALRVIDAIVTAYTEARVVQHEAAWFPPVRGLKQPIRDPLSDPLAGFKDDLPWEVSP